MTSRTPLIVHTITSLDDGGAEGTLYRLCTTDRRHRHMVVSLRDGGKYGPLLAAAGVPVHCLDMPAGRPTLRGLVRLWRLLRRSKPDVVQTWLYHGDLIGGVVARLAGVGNVSWGIRHSNLTSGTVKRHTIWVARACALLSRRVPSTIVCCSHRAAGGHIGLGYDEARFCVIPNGYDLDRLAPDAEEGRRAIEGLGLPPNTPILGMVARYDPQKDHANLAAALGSLARRGVAFHCLLVGGRMSPDNPDLMRTIAEHGLDGRVSLLGRRNDVGAIMNAIDVHVLSSLGEAFPNVLAEAMACGTPCVTTDVGDAAAIVGETGWVVPPGDATALAAAIEQALRARAADTAGWERRRAEARRRIVENFSMATMLERYHEVWNAKHP